MLDPLIRRISAPALEGLASRLVRLGLHANVMTLIGFGIGLSVIPALAVQEYGFAIVAILLNRLADGLDGPMARQQTGNPQGSAFGSFLDIVCDFIFYAAVPFGFALGDLGLALWSTLLLFAFVGTGSSFLAFAVMASRHNLSLDNPERPYGSKGFHYLGGLTEGSETIGVFIACCIWPKYFAWFAGGFALACLLTTLSRMYIALNRLT